MLNKFPPLASLILKVWLPPELLTCKPPCIIFDATVPFTVKTSVTVKSSPTVKSFVIVTLFDNPIVKVWAFPLVTISFAVPIILKLCESKSTAGVPVFESPKKSKSCAVTWVST